ncbi:MAG: response regulator [Clostridiales bacterium]|nr:response regulator [Clostridiales bacterium]
MNNGSYEKSILDYLLPLLENDGEFDSAESSEALNAARQIRALIDEIPGGFVIYHADKSEKIVYANKALLDIFACKTYSEFIKLTGGTFRGLVHPDDLDRVEDEILAQISEGDDKLDYVEYRITRKDGVMRWVEDYGHYVPGNNGDNFFYVFITDATEKITKQLLERATLLNDQKEKEQRLQSLIEEYDKERTLIRQEDLQRLKVIEGLSMNYDSIIYADLDQNLALPYRLSTRLVSLFTKRFEERELTWVFDEYIKRWVHPDDREDMAAKLAFDYIRNELSENKTYNINYRCVINGKTLYYQMLLAGVGSEEGEDGVHQIVIGCRVTDDEVQQELKHKQLLEDALEKAKIADIAKNTFLSNMSHDMRTPLNAIFGYLQLARKMAENDAVQTYLDKIEFAGKEILDMVEKVLEITYSESQDYTLNEQPFNILDVLNHEIEKVSPRAKKKDVSIAVHTDMLANADVMGDKDKLAQVLNNLVDNAVKYNKKGGKVDITVMQKVNLPEFTSTFTFEVKDNGVGISEEAIGHIFDPFVREHNTTLSGEYGTGLGLTITKRLVQAMNGTIHVDSKLGTGTTFTVSISLLPYMPELDPILGDEEPNIEGMKILIVEDNEINLEIETEILEDFGFNIDSAENGQIAVDKVKAAKKGDYDLVLMDIQMPVMDGRTAAREIRKLNHPLSTIPIIALSANAFESDRIASLEAGMDAHINKPLDVDVLIQAIHSAFTTRKKR